jgi:hypothetical protein
MNEQTTDILIVGASTGGCAAALAASSMGLRVIMTEETDWIGGQLTSQAVPPDEHPWIEQFGCTRHYRHFREGVRQYYRDNYPLLPGPRKDPYLNPGGGWVSPICHEFRVGLAVLNQMLAYPRSRGIVHTMLRHKPVAVETDGDYLKSVSVVNLDTGEQTTLNAPYILDATELGDLLALGNVEYISGAESQDQTGEPHAVVGDPQPDNVQSISWCFVMSYDPDGEHIIDEPEQYDFWRDYDPQLTPPWPGKMLDFTQTHPITLEPYKRVLFLEDANKLYDSIWEFRKIINRAHYAEGAMPHEATLVNWPQIDYLEANIIDKPDDEIRQHLKAAKQQALSLFYWMQSEAPRPDGGMGYPGLYLRPDITGTADGFAKHPYIRESRRIKAEFTVTELHVGYDARQSDQAEFFEDSVGVGCYRIDLHPSTGRDNYIDVSSLPFQIPLGSLIPVRVENLLPACKNIGVTHITNGCYRLHPVEWNIGESAGFLAAYCLLHNVKPRQVYQQKELFSDFQALLHNQGVETAWPRLQAV